MSSRNKLLKAAALALVGMTGACSDNLARRDTIAYSAGNSIAANRAIQTINPWPRGSYVRGQETDGAKAQQAVRRYLAPDGAAVIAVPAGGPAAGAATNGQ